MEVLPLGAFKETSLGSLGLGLEFVVRITSHAEDSVGWGGEKAILLGQSRNGSLVFFMCSGPSGNIQGLQGTSRAIRVQDVPEAKACPEAKCGGWDYVLKGPHIHE